MRSRILHVYYNAEIFVLYSKTRLGVKDCNAQIVRRPPRRCGAEIKWVSQCVTRAACTLSYIASRDHLQ